MVKACPVTAELETSEASIVLGCPGVPRSVPRISTKLLIRSLNGTPFTLRGVGIELRACQSVSIPLTIGSSDSMHEYKLYEDPFVFSNTFGTFQTDNLIGVDIPILIHLPKDITSSGYNSVWNATTTHFLLVKVSVGDTADTEIAFAEKFPVAIKTYDSLPIYRQFTESVNESVISHDQQMIVEYHLKQSCIGPNDPLLLDIKVMKNLLNYKVHKLLKLKTMTFQIKEILECHEGGLPPLKDNIVVEDIRDCRNMNLNDEILFNYNFKLPMNSDFLTVFENKHKFEEYNYFDEKNDGLIPHEINNHINHKQNQITLIDGVPITHYQRFTTPGKLFSIRYEIQLRMKLIHGKDFTVYIPLVISPFNKPTSEYLLGWIIKECQLANEVFGKQVVNQLVQSYNLKESNAMIQKFKHPVAVYKYNKSDWGRLGYSIDSVGTPIPLSMVID